MDDFRKILINSEKKFFSICFARHQIGSIPEVKRQWNHCQLLAQQVVSPFRFKLTLKKQEVEEQVCRSFLCHGAQPPVARCRRGDRSSTKRTETSSKPHRNPSCLRVVPFILHHLRDVLSAQVFPIITSPGRNSFLGCAGRWQRGAAAAALVACGQGGVFTCQPSWRCRPQQQAAAFQHLFVQLFLCGPSLRLLNDSQNAFFSIFFPFY